jgi:hypothetical protein
MVWEEWLFMSELGPPTLANTDPAPVSRSARARGTPPCVTLEAIL